MTDEEPESIATMETLAALIAEVRRLRALPVIATCGECGAYDESDAGRGGCLHRAAPRPDAFYVDADRSPPSWCPLRRRGLSSRRETP